LVLGVRDALGHDLARSVAAQISEAVLRRLDAHPSPAKRHSVKEEEPWSFVYLSKKKEDMWLDASKLQRVDGTTTRRT
jgi:hypothetical protein